MPSDTKIYADEHAEIILIKGVKTLLLRNESVIDGSDYKIPDDAPCDENISVCGGVWGEENEERLGYGVSGRFDENDTYHGADPEANTAQGRKRKADRGERTPADAF